MTTAGPNSPFTVTSEPIGLAATFPWNDPENAIVEDGNYATLVLPQSVGIAEGGYTLRFTNFGFTDGDIPPSSIINGILFEVKVSQTGDAVNGGSQLVYLGSELDPANHLGGTTGNAGFIPDGTDAFWPLGGPTDTGGVDLTQTIVVDSSFGVDLYFFIPWGGIGSTISVDSAQITIFYTEAGSTRAFQAMIIG